MSDAQPAPAERLRRFASEHHAALLAAVLLLAFLIRLGVLLDLRDTVYDRGLSPDEDTYHRWAARIAGGEDTAGFAPDFPRLPAELYAAVYSAFGTDPQNVRVLNLLLGVAICAVAYVIGRMLYGRSAGLVAGLLCAFSESLAFYSATLLHTNLGVLLLGLVIALGISCVKAPGSFLWLKWLAAGVCAGLLANVRANAAVVAVLAVPLAFVVARRVAGARPWAVLAALIALFAGVYAATAQVAGELAGPRFAFNLYMGNNPQNATPYFQPVRFTSSAPEHQTPGFAAEASRRLDRELSLDEAERFWTREVLDRAAERPIAFFTHASRKLHAIFHASPSDNNYDLRVVGAFLPALRLAWLPSWLLLALCIGCLPVLPRDGRLLGGAALFALYAATIAVFFTGERLRAPLLLVAAPYAAAGLCALLGSSAARTRTSLLGCGALFAAALVLARLPLPGAADLSGPLNTHALILLDKGDLDGAERWYRRSLALRGQASDGARIGLAAILQKRGRLDEAVAILEPLPDSHYEAASKHEWLGNLALARRRPRDALRAFETAIHFDSSKQNAYKGAYIANRLLGRDAEAAAVDARLQRVRASP